MKTKQNEDIEDYDEDIEAIVTEFDTCIKDLQKYLEPLLQLDIKEVLTKLPPLQKAKLNFCMAYSVNTLFYSKYFV